MKRRYGLSATHDVAIVPISFQQLIRRARAAQARRIFSVALCAAVFLCLLFGQVLTLQGNSTAHPLSAQDQVIPVGVLWFQDESGSGAPAEFGPKIAQDLQQRLNATFKNLLARPLKAGADASAIRAMTVEQLAALGKQNGVKYVVRGGLLAVNAESIGGELKTIIQLYADVISTETSAVNSVRAEGAGTQPGTAAALQWKSIDLAGGEFRNTSVGQALSSSLEQLATAVHQAIAAPASQAGLTENNIQTDPAQVQAAEADEELQQLVAQAESLLANSSAGSAESLQALSQALEGLKSALTAKATLLEQAQETTQVDQQVAARKQELQAAVDALTQQVSSADAAAMTDMTEGQEVSGEKKNVLATISEYLGETVNILQKIQEIRSTFRSAGEEAAYDESASGAGSEEYAPAEAPLEEVGGVVTDSGEPAEGVTVTEPESGASATTGSDGSYALKVISGKLVKLVLAKNGKKMTTAQLDLPRGRSATADFELKTKTGGASAMPLLRVVPSTVMVSALKTRAAQTGTLKGVVRDAQGRPVPRALVSLKGLAVARTDSQGQYLFLNVPAGVHQLTVQKSGWKLKAAPAQVAAKRSSESKIQFASGDRIANSLNRPPVIARGTGTVLRGVILDHEKRPLPGAKVTVMQSASAVSVLTGPKGNYELRDLKPGSYRILISKVGYDGGAQTIALRTGGVEQRDFGLKKMSSPLIERALQRQRASQAGILTQGRRSNVPIGPIQVKKGQLAGRIIDAQSGKPLQGATVSLQRQASLKTDQGGHYTFPSLAPGSYRVNVNKAGFIAQEKTITIRADSPTREDFALKVESRGDERKGLATIMTPTVTPVVRSGQVRGRVIDAKTGKPIPVAAILIAGQPSVTTNPDGSYVIANLGPGTYQISVRKSGFADGGGALTVRAGQTVTLNFQLSPKLVPVIRLPRTRTQ